MTYELHHGDCIEVMAAMPAESIDAIVTSPPYAMQRKSTYGGIQEAEYPAWTVAWMDEAKRLLKPGGSAIINISPHKVAGGLSDYVLRTRLALRDAGWTEIDEIVWHKTDAMPTGAPSRPRRSWESLLWYGKDGAAWGNPKANGTPTTEATRRRFYKSTADSHGWSHGISGGNTLTTLSRCTNVLSMAKVNNKNGYDHPAPFPWQLAEWCGKLICPPGGTMLDPFSGSGSTGIAALRNGWDFIGVDVVREYVDMSRERLTSEALST